MKGIPNPIKIKGEVKAWGQTLFPILITIAIVVIIWKVYKAFKVGANAAGAEIGIAGTAIKTGISADRISYIASLAQSLWDNSVNTYWLAPTDYHESDFISALNQMLSNKELELLDQYYRQAAKESLKKAVTSSFSAADRAAVKPKTWAALMLMA